MIFQSLPSHLVLVLLSLSTVIDNTGSITTSWNALRLLNTDGCVCPGDTVSYECRIASEPEIGSTLWRGSALASQCPEIGGEIILRHRTFTQARTCGNITGRGIGIEEDGYYISQLNITVDSSMDNDSVECIYNNGTNTTMIGSTYIEILSIKDPFPPPNNVTISNLVIIDELSIQVTFEWSVITNGFCPALFYNNIVTSNCGVCPNSINTSDTTAHVTCTEVLIGQLCTFSVHTSVCNSLTIEGNATSITAAFNVPASPIFNIIPVYSHSIRNLSAINTTIIIERDETETFNIYEQNLLMSLIYTVVYMDSASGKICGSTDIPSSSYTPNKACSQIFNFSLSACPSAEDIIIDVFGTNVIGRGPSLNFTLGIKNVYVEVTFDVNFTRATCKFLQWQPLKTSQCTCSISYGNDQPYIQSPIEASWSDTVVLNLATESLPPDEYHFIVTATYDTFSALVEGTFIKYKNMDTATQSTVSILVFGVSLGTMGVVVLLIIVALLSVIFAVVFIRSKKKSRAKNEPSSVSEPPAIDTERNVAYEVIQL